MKCKKCNKESEPLNEPTEVGQDYFCECGAVLCVSVMLKDNIPFWTDRFDPHIRSVRRASNALGVNSWDLLNMNYTETLKKYR